MNEHDDEITPQHSSEVADRSGGFGASAVPLDQGHVEGHGLPEKFENPGLPAHLPRQADLDEGAAKRAEKQVAALFGLSIIGTLVFLVAYFAVSEDSTIFIPGVGVMPVSHLLLGVGLGVSLLGIGMGAVHWSKTLMPDEEVVEMRHPMRSSDDARSGAVKTFLTGGQSSQLPRRPLLKYTLGGALGLFSLPLLVQLVGGLGPLPKNELSVTYWNGPVGKDGKRHFVPLRLMRDPENTPIKAEDVTLGSAVHVMPEGLLDLEKGILEEKAKAAVLLMRLEPELIQSAKELDWGYEGIVAYSKICTHVGCPVGLYEQQTHHLLCPCHQSTFDVTRDAKVIFGPAGHPLPQLKITVDDEGYLIAAQPFQEAVGPSFWERG